MFAPTVYWFRLNVICELSSKLAKLEMSRIPEQNRRTEEQNRLTKDFKRTSNENGLNENNIVNICAYVKHIQNLNRNVIGQDL